MLLIHGDYSSQIHRETGSRMVLPRAKVWGNGELVFTGYAVSVLKMDGGARPLYLNKQTKTKPQCYAHSHYLY